MPTVADLIIGVLARAGVSRIFGVLDGGSAPGLPEAAQRAELPFVRCHGASAACIMAGVTGELTGCPGVATVTRQGVIDGVTGIAHARLDRAPLLLLTGRQAEPAPLSDLVAPLVKGTLAITPDSASHWVAHAVQLALSDPRGPVHLDLAADVASQQAIPMATNVARREPSPDPAALDHAAAMIVDAKRPLVVAGLECRGGDARWLHAFCEAVPAPVLTTVKGKGAIPEPHPLAMGVLEGGALDERLLARADLVITFGVDHGELAPWPSSAAARILSFARRPSDDVLRPFTPTLEVIGDLASILAELAPRLVGRQRADWDVVEVDRIRRERLRPQQVEASGFDVHRIVHLARQTTPAGSIAAVDRGTHFSAAAMRWQAVAPGEFITSQALAPTGFALPAAIAAQLVHPGRSVLCFTTAHGLIAAVAELETAARLELPIVTMVFELTGDAEIDIAVLARAMGVRSFIATDEPSFRAALSSSLGARRPSVIAVALVGPDARAGI